MNAIRLKLPILILLILLVVASPSYAQSRSSIKAVVDRTTVPLNETFVLTVIVNAGGANLPPPTPPSLENFIIIGTSSSSEIQLANGVLSAQYVYHYRLQPKIEGDLVIDSFSTVLDGQTFNTDPITVQVSANAAPVSATPTSQPADPQTTQLAGQEFFVEAEVDNPNPYLGEQLIYTFRFYQAANLLRRPRYQPPNFTNFWSEQQPDQGQYTIQIADQLYQVTELKTILFPTAAEAITIEPTILSIPGGLLRAGLTLETDPITVDVKPLPPDAPPGFNGSVGQFALTSEIDTFQSRVNEPVTLVVTLEGEGNLNTIPDPDWPKLPGWRGFDIQSTTTTETRDERVRGKRIYERLLIPETAGELTVPSISYTFFDPYSNEYRTLATNPLAVSVAPGDAEPPQQSLFVSKEAVEQVATDIRFLKPSPAVLTQDRSLLINQTSYWLGWAVPSLLLAGHLGLQWHQQRQRQNIRLVRSAQAQRKAKNALLQAQKQPQNIYTAADHILTTYLADKLDQPVVGLTQSALTQRLAARGVSPELVKRVQKGLVEIELGRFTPAMNHTRSVNGPGILDKVDALINDLEKTF